MMMQGSTEATVCSNEAYLYNLSACPPKKRFKGFQAVPLLPAKKRVQAFQFAEELSLLLKADEEEREEELDHQKKKMMKKEEETQTQAVCRFCETSGESEVAGELMRYCKGRLVCAGEGGGEEEESIHVHLRCAEWAPNVYFGGVEEERVYNLESEMARAHKLKCYACGVKGAALGCFLTRCRKSFHYTCARRIDNCKWDENKYLFLCPEHASCSFPRPTKRKL